MDVDCLLYEWYIKGYIIIIIIIREDQIDVILPKGHFPLGPFEETHKGALMYVFAGRRERERRWSSRMMKMIITSMYTSDDDDDDDDAKKGSKRETGSLER